MRRILLALLLPLPAMGAQVIECPKFYPWQDTRLAEVPYQHRGKGFVAKARLTGAGMYIGELNGRGELQGDGRKVKAGWEIQHRFTQGELKWLVCSYGGGTITWWEQLAPQITACKLQIQDGGANPLDIKVTCQ